MSEKELVFRLTKADFEIQTFASGGPGGQHQNKTASGVRIVHPPSGAIGESREYRSQLQNKQAAFRRLVADPKLNRWVKMRIAEKDGVLAQAEAYAEREINTPDHIQVEVQVDGKWTVQA